MYYKKEQILQLLDCGRYSFKYFISEFNIEKTLIKSEMLYSKLSVDNAFEEIKKVHDVYSNSYYTVDQCEEMGVSSYTIQNKLERIVIPTKYKFFNYKKTSFLLLKEQSYFDVKKELIRFKDAIDMLPYNKSYGKRNLRAILTKYNIPIDYTFDRISGHVYKSDMLNLLNLINERYKFNKENYITISHCRDMGFNYTDLKLINKKKPEYLDLVHEFAGVLMLYDKKNAERLFEEKENGLICEKDIMNELGFKRPKKFNHIINNYGISCLPRNNSQEKKMYKKQDFTKLKKIIFERYKFNKEYFYSAKDLKKLNVEPHEKSKFSAIKTEFLDQIFEFSDALIFYEKSEVKKILLSTSKSSIKKRTIKEKELSTLQDLNLECYIKVDKIKNLFDYSNHQILPFARKFNLQLNILYVQRQRRNKISNKVYTVRETYFLIDDVKKVVDFKNKINKKNLSVQEVLQRKDEKLRNQQEKEAKRLLTFKRKEEIKLRNQQKKEVAHKLSIKKKEEEKLSNHKKYIRNKMLEYKKRLLEGENIRKLFYVAIIELDIIDNSIMENNEFKAWINFFTKKLSSTSTNGRTLYKKFCRFLTLTKNNSDFNLFNDLPNVSTKILNTRFFNNNENLATQEELYTFLKFYASNNKTNYNFLELRNPYQIKRSITNKNRGKKEIYTIEEYIELIQYVSNVHYHKKEIEFWHKKKASTQLKYRSYESVWLYVILSLNNMWRNFDILTKVPIITIPSRFQTLEDYYKYDLTYEESQTIIFELISKYKTFKSAKADKDGNFFCSDELVVPLANALVACILYKNANDNVYVIEHTTDFTLASRMQKAFFTNFKIPNFKFKSKKMNSTIATYTYEYIKKYTNENPIITTSFMRPHSDINTTNHYIDLPQDQLNQITNNLFEGGYFGYTFDYMYKLITGESLDLLEFNNKRNVITIFKDANKIENISKQLLFIENKYESLHQYLNSLKIEEVEHQLNLISLKQLPAKDEHWQCILGECLYLNRNCISCPFAIPHFYSLTACIENLILIIGKYKNQPLKSVGEKRFLANRIYQYLLYLSDAKKEFGSEFLNEFSNNRYSTLLNEILNLPDFTCYITISRGEA